MRIIWGWIHDHKDVCSSNIFVVAKQIFIWSISCWQYTDCIPVQLVIRSAPKVATCTYIYLLFFFFFFCKCLMAILCWNTSSDMKQHRAWLAPIWVTACGYQVQLVSCITAWNRKSESRVLIPIWFKNIYRHFGGKVQIQLFSSSHLWVN